MSIKFDKTSFRSSAKRQLVSENLIFAKCKHYALIEKLFWLLQKVECHKFSKFQNGKIKNILIFNPLGYEPNLIKFRRNFNKKYKIYLPFMLDKSLKVVKSRQPFLISKFGVREACNSNAYFGRLDAAVIPVIGVDGDMARIGHGKGFYDRFFNDLSYRPLIIFIGIKDLFIKENLCDNHDIRCDFYITPRKNYIKRGKNDRNFSWSRSRLFGYWHRVSNRKKDK